MSRASTTCPARYVEDADDVAGFILAFDGLTQQALGQGESAELIRELAQDR